MWIDYVISNRWRRQLSRWTCSRPSSKLQSRQKAKLRRMYRPLPCLLPAATTDQVGISGRQDTRQLTEHLLWDGGGHQRPLPLAAHLTRATGVTASHRQVMSRPKIHCNLHSHCLPPRATPHDQRSRLHIRLQTASCRLDGLCLRSVRVSMATTRSLSQLLHNIMYITWFTCTGGCSLIPCGQWSLSQADNVARVPRCLQAALVWEDGLWITETMCDHLRN